jgi:hypothetical protein
MNTKEPTLDFFMGYTNLIKYPNEIRSHFLDRFSGRGGNAEKTFKMNRSGILIISARVRTARF